MPSAIDDFARWLIQFEANTLRLWILILLIVFWAAVGALGYHLLANLGVMYR